MPRGGYRPGAGRKINPRKLNEYKEIDKLLELCTSTLLKYMKDPLADPDKKAQIAMQYKSKHVTTNQQIVSTSINLSLNNEQKEQLISLARRNALIYDELDKASDKLSGKGLTDELTGKGLTNTHTTNDTEQENIT